MIKQCACGCGEELNPGSPWVYKRGHKPKKNGAPASRKTKTRVSLPRTRVATPKPAKIGVATICVTEANLDSFWSRLSLEEKAALYQMQLEGA